MKEVQCSDFLSAFLKQLYNESYVFSVRSNEDPQIIIPDNLKLDYSRGILVRTAETNGTTGDFYLIPCDGKMSIPLHMNDFVKSCNDGTENPEAPSVSVCVACVPLKVNHYSSEDMLNRHLRFVDTATKLNGTEMQLYLQ